MRKIEVKKRGNNLGIWFFKVSLRLFGLRGAYGLLYIVCLYYLFFDRAAVSASLAYTKRRFPDHAFLKQCLDVYRLFVSQGKQLIDRYTIISGKHLLDIRAHGCEQTISLIDNSSSGIILLTAHAGNWQVAMTALKKLKKKIYFLMRPEDNPAVEEALHISGQEDRIGVISPEEDLGGVVKIMKRLKNGEIVSIMGDRHYGFNAIDVSFLGEKAWFPYGAFVIAAAVKCPVVVLLSAKVSTRQYIVDLSNVLYPRREAGREKGEQLRQWVGQFTQLLEGYVEKYPYQCFLFSDIWKKKS